ncbi:hypothetical protein [Streptomyces sp. Inha503]|uniref:hypothetical protein n=1 Tax=Streptomyces sp. Inha503 TaxID=3383314 RepID=UPI0039A1DE1A
MGKAASSLTLYTAGTNDKSEAYTPVKTTMMFRSMANPRRTTLAHVKDVQELKDAKDIATDIEDTGAPEEQPEQRVDLPNRTANPKRTVLTEAPGN